MKLVKWSAAGAFMIVLSACSNSDTGSSAQGDSEDWKPDRSIEFVAPAGAGGGWDTTARMLSKVIEEEGLADQSFGVVNKPGGGGAVGWAYINNRNDPHNIFVASPPLLFIPLNGQSEYGYEDFTPLANLIADYGAFAVREDAKWDTLDELFEDMRDDPASVSIIGASAPGSMDHMQFVTFADAAGVDITKIKYVSDQEGGALTAVLNGSVEVLSSDMSEAAEQARAGKLKILATTAPERLEGDFLENIPTGMEQGIDAQFVIWRGIFGPGDMSESEISYYEDLFREASESEAFDEIRVSMGWDEEFMGHEEFKSFLDEQNLEIEELINDLGLGQ
ncbi:tripartite tricarboxylate transporter substrate binding protein [Alkalicoccobacillus plakortidis]|uniref:Tripartite tricarboxylate transporter substrate-binding protein n=1 Tax=Alkalicoccobacillus plakortidis TaxID=444060 RepID=A0ABT0XMI9_9BACI|nr:tripartite tricarboxylate transporter substrate-binding protein [Alkalicoccobacillus plakortidis]MCM2676935.1 tripartite tricarboxylate transporter substrate-binding protein [Alkalicoccobacillus plakortidis]